MKIIISLFILCFAWFFGAICMVLRYKFKSKRIIKNIIKECEKEIDLNELDIEDLTDLQEQREKAYMKKQLEIKLKMEEDLMEVDKEIDKKIKKYYEKDGNENDK